MPTAPSDPPGQGAARELLERAVAAGILTAEQAAAVAALEEWPEVGRRRRALLAEVLGYVGGALAVVAALFLGAELWGELGPWPRVLLLGAVAVACLAAGAALGERADAGGRLGGFLWAAAVAAVAGTVGVAADGLLGASPNAAALAASVPALALAAVLWWRRPGVLQHVATFGAAIATLFSVLYRLEDGTSDLGGPLLWVLGLVWVAASALPPARPGPSAEVLAPEDRPPPPTPGGVWRPAEPGWVLGALAAVAGPLFAPDGRAAWLVLGAVTAAALVAAGVRLRRPWVAAVGTGGVFLSVPLAVAELFDARLGPLVGILAVGLALVGAAVVLTRRAAR
jgi:hypothetical protein